ncbi:hypothetical protein KI387_001155, partial [Taxus chinensis]
VIVMEEEEQLKPLKRCSKKDGKKWQCSEPTYAHYAHCLKHRGGLGSSTKRRQSASKTIRPNGEQGGYVFKFIQFNKGGKIIERMLFTTHAAASKAYDERLRREGKNACQGCVAIPYDNIR